MTFYKLLVKVLEDTGSSHIHHLASLLNWLLSGNIYFPNVAFWIWWNKSEICMTCDQLLFYWILDTVCTVYECNLSPISNLLPLDNPIFSTQRWLISWHVRLSNMSPVAAKINQKIDTEKETLKNLFVLHCTTRLPTYFVTWQFSEDERQVPMNLLENKHKESK